jgi:hypothetical protein
MKTLAIITATLALSLSAASAATETPVVVAMTGVIKQQASAKAITTTNALRKDTMLKLFGVSPTVTADATKFVYYNSAIYLASLDGTTTYGTMLTFGTPNKLGGPVHSTYQDAMTMVNGTLTGSSYGHIIVFNAGNSRFGDGSFTASTDDAGAVTIIKGSFITGRSTAFTPPQ